MEWRRMAGSKRSRLEWVRSDANEMCVLLELVHGAEGKGSRVLLYWGGGKLLLGVV